MAAVEITPAMVLEVTPVGSARAERIAAYATLRFGGLRVPDAAREAGLTYGTARNYDQWVRLLRARFDLPDPPRGKRRRPQYSDFRDAGRVGGHQRNHVQRGVISPDCELCRDGVR